MLWRSCSVYPVVSVSPCRGTSTMLNTSVFGSASGMNVGCVSSDSEWVACTDPLICGSRADQACGRASRDARRLAFASRIAGSLLTASSYTRSRSSAPAVPKRNADKSRAVTARLILLPLRFRSLASEDELVWAPCIDQRIHDGFEQALVGPLVRGNAAHETGIHHRRFPD